MNFFNFITELKQKATKSESLSEKCDILIVLKYIKDYSIANGTTVYQQSVDAISDIVESMR